MPSSPIPFPAQAPPLRLRAREFFVVPVPETGWHWSCQHCPAWGPASTAAELGQQIATHHAECTG